MLSLPFCQYAVYNTDNAFAAAVSKALDVKEDEHAASMVRAAILLKQNGDHSLGQFLSHLHRQGWELTSNAGLDRFGELVPC